MKSKDKLVLLLFGMIIAFGLLIAIPNTVGIQRETTISTVASKDTYVDSGNPTANYGGVNYLMTGFSIFGDVREAYFYFNFSDKPSNFIKAEISLLFWSVSQTMNFTVCLIEEEWNELTMTWVSNRPSKGQVLDNILISSTNIYTIDITSLVARQINFSICVYIEIDNYVDDYAYITSREGDYLTDNAPQLIWTFTENAEITVTNPTSSTTWQNNNTYTIEWTSLGTIENVWISLYQGISYEQGIVITVFGFTENDGEYEYYVSPSQNYKGTDFRIKIRDHDDSSVYDYSDYFSINVVTGDGNGVLPSIPSYNVLIIFGIIGMVMIILSKKNRRRIK